MIFWIQDHMYMCFRIQAWSQTMGVEDPIDWFWFQFYDPNCDIDDYNERNYIAEKWIKWLNERQIHYTIDLNIQYNGCDTFIRYGIKIKDPKNATLFKLTWM